MSEKNSFLGIGTYLKKINDSFDAKKSLLDVIDNFRCKLQNLCQNHLILPCLVGRYGNSFLFN